jgi:hypothetical protein
MEHSKLFKVLVAGGAALAASCGGVAPSGDDAGEVSADDAGALENCGICPNELCCVTDESGTHTVPGMMCCWGTSC